MLLYVRNATVHGRHVLCLVAEAASVLVVVACLVLAAQPEDDLHDRALHRFLDLSHVRELPSVGAEVFHGLFASNRLGLRVFLGAAAFVHAVGVFALRSLSDHLGEHRGALCALRFVSWLQALSLVLCLLAWVVLGNWSGSDLQPLLEKGWADAMHLYLYDYSTQGLMNDVQQRLQCCAYDQGYKSWQWVYQKTEPVPYSCCRADSFLPCPISNISRFLQYEQGARLLREALTQKECPEAMVQYFAQWPFAYIPLLFVVLSQCFVFSKLALSSKHNMTKNRDPLAPAPAAAFDWLCRSPVPKRLQR